MEWGAEISREEAEQLLRERRNDLELKHTRATSAFRDELQVREYDIGKTHLGDCCCDRPSVNRNNGDKLKKCLIKIGEAWQRIEDGTYGICPGCKKPIFEGRLKAIPEVELCVSCKNLKNLLPIGRVGAMSRELAQ